MMHIISITSMTPTMQNKIIYKIFYRKAVRMISVIITIKLLTVHYQQKFKLTQLSFIK